jgi:tetratricopeptide (TPR) repeat protein
VARQLAVEQEVLAALKEAERLQEQAKWPEALSDTKRAEGLLAGSTSDDLAERVRQLRKDVEMVLRLDEIRLLSKEWRNHQFDYESADRAYALAFAAYGIDVLSLPVEEAAARIRERPGVALALVDALDEWSSVRRRKDAAGSTALTAVAAAADSDPWRWQVREAAKQKDGITLAALADSPDLLRQPPNGLLMLAGTLHLRGRKVTQIDVLRRAQRQYPGDFFVNYELATVLADMGPTYRDEAISFYRAAVAARPNSSAALNDLAGALRQQGKLDEAIAICRKAIELDPNIANAHCNIALALRSQGKLDEAIAWYTKAIKLDPKNPHYTNSLGNAYLDQGELEKALECYRGAIAFKPAYAIAHMNVGLVYMRKGSLEQAIEWYRKSIDFDPKYASGYSNLGNALVDQGKLDDAIDACRKAIKLDPNLASAHHNLGYALRKQQKPEEAIACFLKAIELDPRAAKPHFELATLLATRPAPKLRDRYLAVEHAKKAVELQRQSSYGWQVLGWAQYRAGAWRESIEALEKSCKLQSGTGDGGQWIVLALAHARLAVEEGVTDQEREHHKLEARRRYEEASKQIESWWSARPTERVGRAIWEFREEARALIGATKGQK